MEMPDFQPPYFCRINSKIISPFFEFWRSLLPNQIFRRLTLVIFITELIWFGFLFQMTIDQTNEIAQSVIGVLAIFVAASLAFWLAEKIKIPNLAAFLLFGILFRPFINLSTGILEVITLLSLAIILFLAGFEIEVGKIKKLVIGLTLLTTFGLLINSLFLSFLLYQLTTIALFPAILLAISLAATDLSSVSPVLAKLDFKKPVLKTFAVFEAGLTGAFAAMVILQIATADNLLIFGKTLLLGAVCGLAFGSLILMFVSGFKEYQELKEALPIPILLLAIAIGAYALAVALGGSGLLAAFLVGAIFQVGKHHRPAINSLNELSVLIKAFIFILLGSFVDFGKIVDYLWPGILLALIFIFVIRPAVAVISTWPDWIRKRLSFREIYFLSSIYQTGVVSGCLLLLFIALKLPYAEEMLNLAIIIILTTLIIQPTTTAWLAKRLNLLK